MRKLRALIGSVGFVAMMVAGRRVFGEAGHGHADTPTIHAPAVQAPAAVDAHAAPAGVAATEALKMLADGNARFVGGAPTRPHQDAARLCDTFANGQHPYAAVLSCADSRVPVELVFDAGIGDLFVVRVAGNVGDVDETGTLEYGVEHLGINAIVVMGHTKCGAVTAVVEGAHVTKNIEQLVDNIGPAADQARKAFPQLSGPRLVDKAIRANVNCAISDLMKNSDLLRSRVASGRLKIVGGVYDLHSGEVDWLEPTTTATPGGFAASEHAEPSHDSHVTGKHDAKQGASKHDGASPTTAPVASRVSKDNLPLLGGMLAAGGAVSYGITYCVGRARAGKAATAAAAPKG